MKLFILYQTDLKKSKSSRTFFGIFDCRCKALDSAKYNGLCTRNTIIIVEEVTINQFDEV